MQRIDSFFREVGWPGYPGRGVVPTWSLYAKVGGTGKALVTIYPYESSKYERCIALNLGSLVGVVPDDRLARLFTDLRGVHGLTPHLAGIPGIDGNTYPLIPFAALSDTSATDAVISAVRTHVVGADDQTSVPLSRG